MTKAKLSRKKTSKTKAGAGKKGRVSPGLRYVPWSTVTLEQLNPRLQRQYITAKKLMIARMHLSQGCLVPEHSHFHEQLTYVLEGALKFWIDGKVMVIRGGEVLAIPPHMPHKVVALEESMVLDCFAPPRNDWIRNDDAYLRDSK